jgi:hypothetical protein
MHPGADLTAIAVEHGSRTARVWTLFLVLGTTLTLGVLATISPILCFVAAAGAALSFIFIRFRKFGILTVFFLVPLGPLLWLSPEGTISVQKLLIGALAGIWVTQVLIMKDRAPFHEFMRSRLNAWVLLFLIVFLIAIPWCRDTKDAYLFIFRWISHIVLLYFLVFNIKSFAFLRKCLAAVLAAAFLISLVAIWEHFSEKSILQVAGRDIQLIKGEASGDLVSSKFKTFREGKDPAWARSMATFKGPNELGFFLVFASGLALYFLFRPSAFWRRALVFVLLLLMIQAINYTGSRGSLAGLIVMFAVLTLLSRVPLKWFLITAFSVAFLIYLATPGTGESQWRGGLNWEMMSRDERVEWAKISLNMFLDYPVAGVGLAQFGDRVFEYRERGMRKDFSAPHNIFFQIGAENGILGLLLLLFMIYAVIRESWRIRSDPTERDHVLMGNILLAVFAGIMTFAMTSNVFLDETFWTFLSLIAIASCIYGAPRKVEEEEPEEDILVVIMPRG